jgi:hypothetical protein
MKRIVALIVGLALALPSAALATGTNCGSSGSAYGSQTCQVSNNTQSRSPGTTTTATNATNASTLPFTGLDVVLLVAGGVALLGAGLVVRRLSHTQE